MCQLADRIRDIQFAIKSRTSVHSLRTRTIDQKVLDCLIFQKSNVIAEAAALKTKLRFIDAEGKAQVE